VAPDSAVGEMKAPNLEQDYKLLPLVPDVKRMRAETSVSPGTQTRNSEFTSHI